MQCEDIATKMSILAYLIPVAQAYNTTTGFESSDVTGVTTIATSAVTVGLVVAIGIFAILVGLRLLKRVLATFGVKK